MKHSKETNPTANTIPAARKRYLAALITAGLLAGSAGALPPAATAMEKPGATASATAGSHAAPALLAGAGSGSGVAWQPCC